MSNVFTLDALREEADKQYEPLVVALSDGTESVLKNVLRLNKPTRTAILGAVDALNEGSGSYNEISENVEVIISAVATSPEKLLEDLDGDLALSIKLIERWMNGTQLPEVEPSPSS